MLLFPIDFAENQILVPFQHAEAGRWQSTATAGKGLSNKI